MAVIKALAAQASTIIHIHDMRFHSHFGTCIAKHSAGVSEEGRQQLSDKERKGRRQRLPVSRSKMPELVQQRSNRMETDRNRSGCRTMVAIDESSCSYYALEWALDNLGDSLASQPLVLYNAQPASALSRVPAASYGPARMFTAMSASPELIRSLREQQSKFAMALLERARDICATHGVKAEVVTEVGAPEEAICKAVDRLNIGLLILGSHGRGALERAFLGSVSRHCLKKARCPVIVVTKTAKGEFGLMSRNI